MTIIEVSKQKIVDSIKTEPLKNGRWIHNWGGSNSYTEVPKDCPVCAVGAVLRNVLDEKTNVSLFNEAASFSASEGRSHSIFYEEDLVNGFYMTALSGFFEQLCRECEKRSGRSISRHQMYRIRKKLVKFVEDNFPDNIKIDINGAEPAKDVKVIPE